MRRPKIAIAGFQHETNTFAPFATEFRDFARADSWPALTRGDRIEDVFSSLNIAIGGFLAADFELVPILWANAPPAGAVADVAFERIATEIVDGIAAVDDCDGVLLDLHGAMVTQSFEDGEGELLRRLREALGHTVPIVLALDMHANVTDAMISLSDAICVYRTYPHLDMAGTGARCADLLSRRIAAGRPFSKSMRKMPFLVPMSAQHTGAEPFRSLYGGLGCADLPGVESIDIAAGFPLSDIRDCGPAVLAYGSDAAATADAADRLFEAFSAAERMFSNPLRDPAEAVAMARHAGDTGKPVVLADVQDNPGCGGTSDTTGLLAALVAGGAQRAALGMLWDPEAAARAHELGVGAVITGRIGGRYGFDATPFEGRFRVEALSDGNVIGTGEMFKGNRMALGPMAQLRVLDEHSDVRIVVSSTRFQCLDQSLFRAVGIEPTTQRILAVKSTVHFRADFEPIAAQIMMVASPGASVCSGTELAYRRLREGVRLDVGVT